MKYDPASTGADLDDLLVRRGKGWESPLRLTRQAAAAEAAGAGMNQVPFGHGVSLTSPEANDQLARDPGDRVEATRRAFGQAGFEVRFTPTKRDSDHHTVQLPKPVTEEVATRFNRVLGREP